MSTKTLRAFYEDICAGVKMNVILDTDAYNEVDDQFCIAYLMKRPDDVNLLSINAAPFFNENSTGPADGMERSYQEILKVQRLIDPNSRIPVYRGADAFLTDRYTPVASDACENIIKTVMGTDERVVIIAIGAITNVASALIKCPEIANRAAVIWLGGHATHIKQTVPEFNLRGDIAAAQVVFDSGIDLVQIPCRGVCSELSTTPFELAHYLGGKNAVCDYLVDTVTGVCVGKYAKSRIIWDVSAALVLLCPTSVEIEERVCPLIADDGFYAPAGDSRHHSYYVTRLIRDKVFADLFRTLADER